MDLKEAHELAELVARTKCPSQLVIVNRETGECEYLREKTFNELAMAGYKMYERYAILHRYPEGK